MKKLLTVLAVVLVSIGLKAQTADEIVNKYITAIGGADNLKKLTSIVMEGSTQVQGYDVSLVNTVKCGVGSRMDISVMGMTGYDITTTSKAWKMMPWEGTSDVVERDAEDVKKGQDLLICNGSLANYGLNKVGTVKLMGEEKIDKADCFKLLVTDAGGNEKTYFIDKSTSLIARTIKKGPDGADIVNNMSDYKQVNGYTFAHTMTGEDRTMTWSKITVNSAVEDSKFKPE